MPISDVTPGERSALIVSQLYQGRSVTVDYVMNRCQVSRSTVYRDFVTVERILPIVREPGIIRLNSTNLENS